MLFRGLGVIREAAVTFPSRVVLLVLVNGYIAGWQMTSLQVSLQTTYEVTQNATSYSF